MICKIREIEKDGGVTTYWKVGHKHATTTSYRRGGCLHAGTITLRHLKTGQTVEIDSTTCWDRTVGESCPYLEGLWDKHIGK